MEDNDKYIFNNKNIINQDNTQPLYHQILNYIRHQIKTGTLKPGDPVPPESQLSEMYGVSRTTIRQALNRLVEENLIIRRRGKGTVISNQKFNRDINHLYSFTEDMKAMNVQPHSKILSCLILKAPDRILLALNLPVHADVLKLERVRYANVDAILVETTYLPLYLCPGINQEDFTDTSLYDVLRSRYSLNLFRAIETYEATKLDKKTAGLLGCKSSAPAFSICRIAYLDSGIPFEYTTSLVRSDKCVFKVELRASKGQVSFSREITP